MRLKNCTYRKLIINMGQETAPEPELTLKMDEMQEEEIMPYQKMVINEFAYKEVWKPIGEVYIDSGMILLIDPCNALQYSKEDYNADKECSLFHFETNEGLIVGTPTPGKMPVFGKYNSEGQIKEIKIKLSEEK